MENEIIDDLFEELNAIGAASYSHMVTRFQHHLKLKVNGAILVYKVSVT